GELYSSPSRTKYRSDLHPASAGLVARSLSLTMDLFGDQLVAFLVVGDLDLVSFLQVVELAVLVIEANLGVIVHLERPVFAVFIRQDELALVGVDALDLAFGVIRQHWGYRPQQEGEHEHEHKPLRNPNHGE